MDDSFFGFDASVPLEEDGGRIAEPSEEEYDALNDETFGSAINGDWEEVHENLVRLTDDVVNGFSSNNSTGFVDNGHDNHKQLNTQNKPKQKRKNKQLSDSDLELNLSDMRLDDINMEDGDNMGSANNGDIGFDQSVWSSHPERTLTQPRSALSWNMEGENFSNSFVQNPYAQQHNHHNNAEATAHFGLNNYVQQLSVPKISTLEDIEKSILNQQLLKQQQKQQSPNNQQQQMQGNDQRLHGNMQNLPRNANHMNLVQDQNQHNVLKKETITQQAPPGFAHQDDQRRELITHHVQKLEQEVLQKMQQEHLQRQQQHNQLNITPNHNQIRPPSAESPSNPLFPRYKEQMRMMSQQDEQRRELITQHLKKLDHDTLQKLQQEHLQKLQQQQHQQLNVTANRPPIGIPMYIPQPVAPHMPPHPLISQPGGSHNFAYPYPRPIPAPHLPVALNNFAMHPSFAAMRVAAATTGVHNAGLIAAHQLPRLPPPPNPSILLSQQQQQHQNNSMFNVFNMRLVQEIQQNHPLLQNAIRQAQCQQSQPIMQQNIGNASGTLKTPPQHRGLGPFGNLPPDEFDEYSNLMSTRDKHWLIGIQLSQLNTETPFIDDYYYTVYRERKAVSSGKTQHSQAHKDNQLNHPLTQPKGHAQLILVQLGNKNGTRNGQQRERRSSDGSNILNSSKDDQKNLYIFTPLKFENSLGKLQYGSVTAPRKIIDADIMSIEESIENNSNSAAQSKSIGETSSLQSGFSNKLSTSLQRKTRDILLHIEYLYRIILKLEDLENPTALATILMKKKKESERIAAMEQLENAAKNSDDDTFNITLKNKFNYELEAKDALLGKLVSALSHEKVVAMMNIRKGKVLLRRIMPFLSDSDTRWNIWIAIFSSLQNVIRKDRHDADGLLYGLYPEFKNQITSANFDTIVKIALSISFVDKKAHDFFCSKFGISALVCLILQAENVLEAMNGAAVDDKNTEIWRQFLIQVATSLDQTIQRETISAIIESDSIHPMMNHFGRFKNIKVDSLLDLVKEAKQQIN